MDGRDGGGRLKVLKAHVIPCQGQVAAWLHILEHFTAVGTWWGVSQRGDTALGKEGSGPEGPNT